MKCDDLGTLAVSVTAAGRALGLGRNAAYDAAKTGQIPTVRIGRRLLVPVEGLRRMLADARRSDVAANQ